MVQDNTQHFILPPATGYSCEVRSPKVPTLEKQLSSLTAWAVTGEIDICISLHITCLLSHLSVPNMPHSLTHGRYLFSVLHAGGVTSGLALKSSWRKADKSELLRRKVQPHCAPAWHNSAGWAGLSSKWQGHWGTNAVIVLLLCYAVMFFVNCWFLMIMRVNLMIHYQWAICKK